MTRTCLAALALHAAAPDAALAQSALFAPPDACHEQARGHAGAARHAVTDGVMRAYVESKDERPRRPSAELLSHCGERASQPHVPSAEARAARPLRLAHTR